MTDIEAGPQSELEQRARPRERAIDRVLRRNLPRGLFVRSLLIIIIPMVILQCVVAAVFMERHWQMVTTRLSAAVTRDIAAVIDLLGTSPQVVGDNEIIRIAQERMGLETKIIAGNTLPPPTPIPLFSILDRTLSEQIRKQINRPFWINTSADEKTVEIRVRLDNDRILSVITRRDRTYASNTQIFIFWMVGASLFLLFI